MASGTTRNYTYVDIIREIQQERSLAAIQIVEEAERLGVPKEKAENPANKVLLLVVVFFLFGLDGLRQQALQGGWPALQVVVFFLFGPLEAIPELSRAKWYR